MFDGLNRYRADWTRLCDWSLQSQFVSVQSRLIPLESQQDVVDREGESQLSHLFGCFSGK